MKESRKTHVRAMLVVVLHENVLANQGGWANACFPLRTPERNTKNFASVPGVGDAVGAPVGDLSVPCVRAQFVFFFFLPKISQVGLQKNMCLIVL